MMPDVPDLSIPVSAPLDPAFVRRWFVEGVRQAMSGPAFFVAVAMIGVGGLAKVAGFPAGAAFLSTLTIWAGPAQVLFFGSIAAGVALPAIALSISLSSIRFLPMCLTVLPMLRTKRTRTLTMFVAAHFVAVTVWAESLRRLPDIDRDARLPFFFGFALACILNTAAFTTLGFFLTAALPTPLAIGVLFLTPVYFLSTLVRNARSAIDWLAMAFGLALSPLTQAYVGGGFDLLALGLGGGTIAYLVGRAYERRRFSA
ncbi:MAG: AzlC family ABC transporter permease [Hyphomicrobiales bacterium]|nr:AzlC family ABC transporter permease [Hyphomicrobiales bacterium]